VKSHHSKLKEMYQMFYEEQLSLAKSQVGPVSLSQTSAKERILTWKPLSRHYYTRPGSSGCIELFF